jgi:glycosyltransferase involved in cell wall biosynthesis
MPQISVIIPTFNRSEVLTKTLLHLHNQTLNQADFEIIVIDDGSTDQTTSVVKHWQKSLKNLTLISNQRSGQGAAKARNQGIKLAKSPIILMIGNDIYLKPNALKLHLDAHNKYPEPNAAILGHIRWPKNKKTTTFMRWLDNTLPKQQPFQGPQFAFHLLTKYQPDYRFFYTSNISLKTELLKKNPFRTDFQSYGFEDTELGYRLEKEEKLKIYYQPNIVAIHDHPLSFKDLKIRMQGIGKNLQLFTKLHPELPLKPTKKKLILFKLITHKRLIKLSKKLKNIHPKLRAFYYYLLSKKYFLEAYEKKIKI